MKIKSMFSIMLLIMLISLTLLIGCMSGGKGGSLEVAPTPTPTATPDPTVFTCGSYTIGSTKFACYWEGNTRFDLGNAGEANCIQYDKGALYTGGASNSNNLRLWKNQNNAYLPLDKVGSIYAIFIHDDVVYAAGFVINEEAKFLPCYLEQGNIRYPNLPDGITSGQVNSIYIENNNIYCGGFVNNPLPKPCYWINKQPTIFDYSRAVIKSIYVVNGTVYSCGSYLSSPFFGINQIKQELPAIKDGITVPAMCTSIVVWKGIVYIGGQWEDGEGNWHPCYWAGSIFHPLTEKGIVNCITVFNDKVYAGGYYNDGSLQIPCYWIDGQRYDLPCETGIGQVNGFWVGYK